MIAITPQEALAMLKTAVRHMPPGPWADSCVIAARAFEELLPRPPKEDAQEPSKADPQ